jgi:hypothetical protein
MYLRVCVCLHEGCVRCVLVITRICRFLCHLCVTMCIQILCLHSTPLRLVCRRECSARQLLRLRPSRQKPVTSSPCAHCRHKKSSQLPALFQSPHPPLALNPPLSTLTLTRLLPRQIPATVTPCAHRFCKEAMCTHRFCKKALLHLPHPLLPLTPSLTTQKVATVMPR